MIAVNVVKNDGSVEAFRLQKIINSCVAAGISEELARQVAEEVSRKAYPNIPTNVIRQEVHKRLMKIDKKAATAYVQYEQTKSR